MGGKRQNPRGAGACGTSGESARPKPDANATNQCLRPVGKSEPCLVFRAGIVSLHLPTAFELPCPPIHRQIAYLERNCSWQVRQREGPRRAVSLS
jgi:hypothetical protein